MQVPESWELPESITNHLGLTTAGRQRAIVEDEERSLESVRDALSTRLMEAFRLSTSRAAFGLLYELNRTHLLAQVQGRLRRYGSQLAAAS